MYEWMMWMYEWMYEWCEERDHVDTPKSFFNEYKTQTIYEIHLTWIGMCSLNIWEERSQCLVSAEETRTV